MKTLDKLIDIYRALLNAFWEKMQIFVSEEDGDALLNDWKQANWELIVECNLYSEGRVFLQPYGEGADYYGESSRILRPDALPTHSVCCVSIKNVADRLTGNPVIFPQNGLPIECFVTVQEGWYFEKSPFDCVLILKDDEQLVIGVEDVNFILVKN